MYQPIQSLAQSRLSQPRYIVRQYYFGNLFLAWNGSRHYFWTRDPSSAHRFSNHDTAQQIGNSMSEKHRGPVYVELEG